MGNSESAMANTEIQSFIFKFNQLWKNGFEAELNFKCNAGQAFVSLQVGLGYGAESDSVNLLKKHVAPSQHRRRIRRENARKRESSTPEHGGISESEVLIKQDSVVEHTGEESDVENKFEHVVDPKEEHTNGNSRSQDTSEVDVIPHVEVVSEDIPNNAKKDLETETEVPSVIVPAAEAKLIEKEAVDDLPEIVVVHATAVFRNCPNVSIAQDDLDSVARFITSKDHLVKNIDSIQYDRISNHGMDNNGTYEHSVQVRIAVRRKNLWEGARSYLWKHLAHDLWERSNGTTITLTRIHVK